MSEMTKNIEIRKEEDLTKAILNANKILSKNYLAELSTANITDDYPELNDNEKLLQTIKKEVRFFDITQIVLNKSENYRDKLSTVFNAVGCTGASILMHIKGTSENVSIQFGVRNSDFDKTDLSYDVLVKSLSANFPGTIIEKFNNTQIKERVLDSFHENSIVSTITDIPALRFDEENKERQFMQGIEKIIDTLQGEDYSLLLIADPVNLSELNNKRKNLENLYSTLIPFKESQLTYGINESETLNNSLSTSATISLNENITEGMSHSTGKFSSKSDGVNLGIPLQLSFSMNHSTVTGTNDSDAISHQESSGISVSNTDSETIGLSESKGSNSSQQIKFENHTITQLLKKIDDTLKRYDVSADLGMWNCAIYAISESGYLSQLAASSYHSLIRGKNSSLENGAITTWSNNKSKIIIKSLKHMTHPLLDIDGIKLTPGTLISSSELAIAAGVPNHSIPGIPVIECTPFGRTVSSYDKKFSENTINLGKIFNMHKEERLNVNLDINSLCSHTFITGSTGSGKSNTIYHMLDSLKQNNIKFLVVEPAKGEYKYVFGQDETNPRNCDVHVYGTNANTSNLLNINPFSFPHENTDPSKNIHILEHLDRLVEIFNVCWPMYAAMPAVLKKAVEKSYVDCGWDLVNSSNGYGDNFYPTFADVTRNIKNIIENSEYDKENKGAYKGSLITRLESMTNGINGLLFTTDEIPSKELFDENVIIDLSRIGSAETKSLIMGLLVLKLQEYRMTNATINSPLKHVTVLEEAHNLLKRTSTEQSQDSANLLGKSVEMLTNSIAEMRTYGEGFIIADQTPALLDMAVIRNTNTKIILRLPDQGDRELVGKAANLNDEQIKELAKLPRGVAAVYQNEWVEAVLCKIIFFETAKNHYCKSKIQKIKKKLNQQQKLEIANLLFYGTALPDTTLKELNDCNLSARSKVIIKKWQKDSSRAPEFMVTSPVITELFKEFAETLKNTLQISPSKQIWTDDLNKIILDTLNIQNNNQLRIDINQAVMTEVLLNEFNRKEDYAVWHDGGYLR